MFTLKNISLNSVTFLVGIILLQGSAIAAHPESLKNFIRQYNSLCKAKYLAASEECQEKYIHECENDYDCPTGFNVEEDQYLACEAEAKSEYQDCFKLYLKVNPFGKK